MSSALAVLAAASALLLCPGLAQKHAQADKPFSGLAWAQAAEPLDPDIDLCAALKSAIAAVKYDGKEICVLKSCDVTGTRIACDNIAVSLVIPLAKTTVTDTFSFNAVLDLCPTAGKDLSIALSFSDTGMSYTGGTRPAAPISYESTFSSASKRRPVNIPIVNFYVASIRSVASIDAEITVGIAKVGDNINAQIGADVCAAVPFAGSYCGKSLLPGSLPVRCAARPCILSTVLATQCWLSIRVRVS